MRRATMGTFLLIGVASLALIAASGTARTGAPQAAGVGVNEAAHADLPQVFPPVAPEDDVINPGNGVPVTPPAEIPHAVPDRDGFVGNPSPPIAPIPNPSASDLETAGGLRMKPVPGFERNLDPVGPDALLCSVPEVL